MAKKVYSIREPMPPASTDTISGMSPLVWTLLHNRGITDDELVHRFLNPNYDTHIHDPFLMADMEKAVERILRAIEQKEKILIYSDYDADGIPGGVLLREFFESAGHSEIENYIPHRHDEGYGFHLEAIEGFLTDGIGLIITVDCGIADGDSVKRAQDAGIDVIITDHHEQVGELPSAYAVLDPKRSGCQYPDKNLCGSGVAFKLVQGLLKRKALLKEGQEKWLLDLVGIATLSDMVPLVGENRVFAHYGLHVLRKSRRKGLQEMWSKLRVKQRTLSEDDIGFSLAPRINAASRMGHPMDGFKLLYTKNAEEAAHTAHYLNKINDERKGVVAAVVKEIKKHLRERQKREELPRVLVFGNPDWKPALLGLAANSIAEDVGRCVFVWGRNGDALLKGSCRSDGTTNLVGLMELAKNEFLQFGGHKFAGGFSVSHEKVHTLEEKLNEYYLKAASGEQDEQVWIDAEISLEDVNEKLYSDISQLSPFGVGNEKPVFLIRGVKVAGIKAFGKQTNHIEVTLESEWGKKVKGIRFFTKPENFTVVPEVGQRVNVVANLEKSAFGYKSEMRLRIIDII